MKIYFIRHGATKGNTERRYVGVTDEELLPGSRAELLQITAPSVNSVYISPMKRCRETAAALYPDIEPVVISEFRECNFGDFEYKNYDELKDNKEYTRLIESGGLSGFPNGEKRHDFQKRCIEGFAKIPVSGEDITVIAHGGTIMAIFDEYALPHRDYYFWQCQNGGGFSARLEYKEGRPCLTDIEELTL